MGDFDDFPPGEIPPGVVPVKSHMDLNDVTHAAIERIGRDTWSDERLILSAVRELRDLSLAGVDEGSDVWLVVQARMFDAANRRYPVPLTVAPRRDRAEELRQREEFCVDAPKIDGGAS